MQYIHSKQSDMKKSDRQLIFDKFGGRCAYCGELLQKGWHVDEIEPVVRKTKYIKAHWGDGEKETTGRNWETHPEVVFRKWIDGKFVSDGCQYPENYHIGNQNPACASCNINKHSMPLESFRDLIAGFMKHLNEVSTQYKIAKRYGLVSENQIEVKFYFETINQVI